LKLITAAKSPAEFGWAGCCPRRSWLLLVEQKLQAPFPEARKIRRPKAADFREALARLQGGDGFGTPWVDRGYQIMAM
jgi:hypothetical protein